VLLDASYRFLDSAWNLCFLVGVLSLFNVVCECEGVVGIEGQVDYCVHAWLVDDPTSLSSCSFVFSLYLTLCGRVGMLLVIRKSTNLFQIVGRCL
jgi:hypothetical protein